MYQGLPTFTLLTLSTNTSQSQLQAGSTNIISIGLSVNGNVGSHSKINVELPKDSFILSKTNSNNITIVSEDERYYYLAMAVTCPSFCANLSQLLELTATNSYYVRKQPTSMIIYIQYDGIAISQSYTMAPLGHVPLPVPSVTLSRNTSVGGMPVNLTISYKLVDSNSDSSYGNVEVCISSNISYSKYSNLQYAYAQYSNGSSAQYRQIDTVSFTNYPSNGSLTVTLPSPYSSSPLTNLLTIIGKNTL